MLKFDKVIALTAVIGVLTVMISSFCLGRRAYYPDNSYKVDLNRVEHVLADGEEVSASDYEYISSVKKYDGGENFFTDSGSYVIREINGTLYRIDYDSTDSCAQKRAILKAEAIIASIFAAVILLLLYIRKNIIKPFVKMSELPYELAKGNITAPLNENKSRYFGKFVWGLDMLREELEKSRNREIERIRDEKTLLLSLSHDIKTPLSAVKLYSEAVSRGLYSDMDKCREAAGNISAKVDEIENYIHEITKNSGAESFDYEINIRDVYLSEIIRSVENTFRDRLAAAGTELRIEKSSDCLLSADPDRLAEVLQNIFDNAMKYGDGKLITVTYSDEENCRLITVTNSGCELPENELPHIFCSFWRGSNAGNKQGSGLGLYICRRLMNDMLGEVFAEIRDQNMVVTVVCPKAN